MISFKQSSQRQSEKLSFKNNLTLSEMEYFEHQQVALCWHSNFLLQRGQFLVIFLTILS